MIKEISLSDLQLKWNLWEIYQTPKGVFVAKRKRYFMLTPERVDQGFRDCLIEETGKKMDNQISKQEELSKTLNLTSNGT